MKIGELLVHLGVKADTFAVKDFVRSLGEIPFSVAAAITSLAGASFGFVELTKNTLDMSNSLSMFRAQTGLSTDELQKWQVVAKQMGMSGDEVAESILGINSALAQIRMGGGQNALQAFGWMGVDWRGKDAFQLLREMGENKRGYNPGQLRELLPMAGISPAMLRLFGASDWQGQIDRAQPLLHNSDIDAMQDFQKVLSEFNSTLVRDFVPILQKLEPHMATLAEVLGKIIGVTADVAIGGLSTIKDIQNMHKAGVGYAYAANPANILLPSLAAWIFNQRQSAIRDLNLTQNIHSSADEETVAELAGHHVTRAMVKAANSFDNQGY